MKSEFTLIAPGVFEMSHCQSLLGTKVDTRMVVIQLDPASNEGPLWVWSPIPLDSRSREELDQLGEVKYAVSPNTFHHLYN